MGISCRPISAWIRQIWLVGLMCAWAVMVVGCGVGSTGSIDPSGVGLTLEEEVAAAASPPQALNPNKLFQTAVPWKQSIANKPKSPQSDAIINWLNTNGGWGSGTFRIDFSIEALKAKSSTPFLSFSPTDDFFAPDCDLVPFPVPKGGALEGEQGYRCTTDGDCHLLVYHPPSNKLYEMWRANIVQGQFLGGCAVVWPLAKTYPANLRGQDCTSADAAGLPLSALLFSPDEVAAGSINHAIRFILPNAEIRRLVYTYPATHSTRSTTGATNAPPYGVRFRLRSNFPLNSLPNDSARVIARALQKYGMFLADGGTIALTGMSDRFTTHKWSELGINSFSLGAIKVTDMQVVELGQTFTWQGDCVRNP